MFPSPSDDGSILIVNAGLLIGLLVMTRLLNPRRTVDRILFGLTTAAFLVIYALWRWADTLPGLALSAQSLWPRLFISFESIAILYTLLSIVILFRSIDRSSAADAAQLKLAAEHEYPAVRHVQFAGCGRTVKARARRSLRGCQMNLPTGQLHDIYQWYLSCLEGAGYERNRQALHARPQPGRTLAQGIPFRGD